MTGRTPFKNLMKNWPADRRARHEAYKEELAAEYQTLETLRIALDVSQAELAGRLDVNQPAISKIVNNPNLKIETMREVVEALGGILVVSAVFGDTQVVIQPVKQEQSKSRQRDRAGDVKYSIDSRSAPQNYARDSATGAFKTKSSPGRASEKKPSAKKR